MITLTERRKQGADRARRFRAKKRGAGEIALTRRPAKNAPKPGEGYSAWADRTLQITAGPRRGQPWVTYAWQREVLDMAGRGGRIICLRAAAQTGKTAIGLALAGARLQLGQPVLIVAPTARPAAAEFARQRLEPMLSSAPFAGLLHGERHGGLGRSAAVMHRTSSTGGAISLAGAESPSQLAARGAACLVLDEVARYPRSAGREGDPILLALERTEAWRKTRAVFLVSTPVVPGDPFDEWYASGDRRLWHVPCGHCGAWWTPEWEHVSPGPPAALVCPSCGVEHADGPDRVALLDAGQWRPTVEADDPEVVQLPLAELVFAGLDVDGDRCRPSTRHEEAIAGDLDADLRGAPMRTGRRCPRCWPATGEA